MRIREIQARGLQVWPPAWDNASRGLNEKAVLTGVKAIVGTDLFRIDIEYNGIPYLGIIPVEKAVRDSLYQKLRENVGRHLTAIADLEIEAEQ